MRRQYSIIYINYSPYENAGKILDFLLQNFDYVFLFVFEFHYIDKKNGDNRLYIFYNGRLQKKYKLFHLTVPLNFLFLLLPLKSLINLIQIAFYSYRLKRRYGKVTTFFSVNGFTSWIGVIIKKLNIVDKTLFWVWDYYPPIHPSAIITLIRKIYWYFDKYATIQSDKVFFVNRRLLNLRKTIGVIPNNSTYKIVPIGTESFKVNCRKKKRLSLGFIGVIKKSQGLNTVFDNAAKLIANYPEIEIKIIGSGPDENYFRAVAKKSSLRITFYGYLEGDSFINVLEQCSIGIALYKPDPNDVSYYGDPGKVKIYLSLGLPVIITNTFEFSKEIEENKAGVIISYGSSDEFITAIQKIIKNYDTYHKSSLQLGRKFYYKKIYQDMFEE